MKAVLITLADQEFLNAARQLFVSAHVAGGWRGDYVLLAHEVPEQLTRDFVERGIRVVAAPIPKSADISRRVAAHAAKFQLFDPFVKEWDRVLYLDADIIVRGRLDGPLLDARFGAVRDLLNLRAQFLPGVGPGSLPDKMAFNSGVLSFDTTLIGDHTRKELLTLWNQYRSTTRFVDQPTLNLYFEDIWEQLPGDYNVFANLRVLGKPWAECKCGTIIHFTTAPKPWDDESPAKQEWGANAAMFSHLDFRVRCEGRRWSPAEKLNNRAWQWARFCLARLDVWLGGMTASLRRGLSFLKPGIVPKA